MSNHVNDIAKIYQEQIVESSHLETDMEKRRKANEKAIEDMKKTKAYKEMAAAAREKFDEAFVDPEQGEAPSGRSPLQNVSDHPKASVRKKAVGAFKTQMGKEYGGTWKSRSSDPVSEAKEKPARWWDDDGDGIGYEPGEVSGRFKRKKRKVVDEALRSREERMARMVTPKIRKQQERTRQGREVLADIQATQRALNEPKSSAPSQPTYDTPAAEVRVLKPGQKRDTLALRAKKAMGEAKEKPARWWDDDGDGIGYEPGEVSGKFKRKKKTVKEGYSNWREDLIEVVDKINKNKNEEKITDKQVDNSPIIKINPTFGEAVENLGGTLLEMVEIDELGFIVESVYDELLDEGYEEDDIEEALEYALTEAEVTFGHDTEAPWKRKTSEDGIRRFTKTLGRYARKKLSSKVRDVKKSAKAAVASGARKVAKGALGVARKMEGGEKTPSASHTQERKPSTYRGAGAGQKERVSSGSYTPPSKPSAKPKTQPIEDPWKGSEVTPKPSKPKSKTPAKPKAPAKPKSPAKPKAPAKPKTKRASLSSKADEVLASLRSEEIQIDEKTLTAAEIAKREEIVKSMKKKLPDFEERYPGRGKEVMFATATKVAKRVAEQALELQPKTQGTPDQSQKKIAQQHDRMRQQEVQILQRKLQVLKSAPKGTDPSITAGYEPVGKLVDEARIRRGDAGGSIQGNFNSLGRPDSRKLENDPSMGHLSPEAQKIQKSKEDAKVSAVLAQLRAARARGR